MKKKILFINGHLNTGGVEKSLVDILRNIDLSKYDIKLVLLEDYGDYIKDLPREIDIELVDLHNTYGSLFQSLKRCLQKQDKKCFWIRIVLFLTKWFGKDKLKWLQGTIFKNQTYDCVIGFRPGIVTELAAYSVKAKQRITWWHHGEMNLNDQQKKDYEKACQRMDYVISVSKNCTEFLKEKIDGIEDKLRVIPNMLDADNIVLCSKEYKPFQKKEGIIDFVTVGRLSPEKHIGNAIEVANKLKKNNIKNFRWYIIGDGVERNRLQNLIEEYELENYVCIVGNKKNPYPYMKYADIMVHTSYVESQCLVVLEAMTLNTPCIVTKSLGIKEFAVDNYNCFLVEQDKYELEKKIIKVMKNEIDTSEICRNAVKTVEQFSKNMIICQIEKIFDNLEEKI